MLKWVALLALLVFPITTLADEHSGVWGAIGISGYVTLHIKGNTAVAADLDGDGWLAYMGTSSGSGVTLSNIDKSDGFHSQATITWNGPDSGTIHIDECVSGKQYTCIFPAGTEYQIYRVF